MMAETQMPVEIGRANLFDIKVKWQDAHESVYPARYLRSNCPCAACVDEVIPRLTPPEAGFARDSARRTSPSGSTGQRRHGAVVPNDVKPLGIQLVGNYAISIQWSDGHATGIYAFDKLRKLCPCCSAKA